MKSYAPKTLHGAQLRTLLDDLQATPAEAAKFLKIGERTFYRWLSDDSAPFAALAALWHETPAGRHVTALDVGNEARYLAAERNAIRDELKRDAARLARVLAISDTGAANDALHTGPVVARPARVRPRLAPQAPAARRPRRWATSGA